MKQAADFASFTGGEVDDVVDPPFPNRYQLARNFFVDQDGSLVTRYGSNPDDVLASAVSGPVTRIAALMPLGSFLLKQHGKEVSYVDNSHVMQSIVGPTGNEPFLNGDAYSAPSFTYINGHNYITNDTLDETLVQKILLGSSGTPTLFTAGLPAPSGSPVVSTPFGTGSSSVSYLYRVVYRHNYTDSNGVEHEVVGPALEFPFIANDAYLPGNSHTVGVTLVSGSDLISGIGDFTEDDVGSTITGAGIPASTTIIQFISATSMRMSQAATASGAVAAGISDGGNNYLVSGMPSLYNSNSENWDIDNIKVDVYRTINGGVDFFYVGTLNNSAHDTFFTDTTNDTVLVNRAPLYTNGGGFDNDPPPICKYVHATDIASYYANIKEGTETLSSEIRQSKPGLREAVPASFSATVEGVITGVSSVRSIPVVFCESAIYRIDGVIDEFGQGQMIPVKISDKIGCVGGLSIVQTIDALYFAGTDGFYMTDGYKVTPISAARKRAYSALVTNALDRKRIYGVYEATARRIHWAVDEDNNAENYQEWILHLEQPIGPDNQACFTSFDGKRLDDEGNELETTWTASSLAFFNGKIYRGQANGYTHVFDSLLYNDERLLDGNWVQVPIQYDHISNVSSFESPQIRKWVPMLAMSADPITNITCQIQTANNKQQQFTNLKEIYIKTKSIWGDSYWGDPLLWTDLSTIFRQRRYFPAGLLWAFYKQLRFKNSFSLITSSDNHGAATITGTTTKTITLAGDEVFPVDTIDYYFQTLVGDTYSDLMLITAWPAPNQVTISDPDNLLPAGSDIRWRIKGYCKGDGLKLLSYSIFYDPMTPTQKGNESSQVPTQ